MKYEGPPNRLLPLLLSCPFKLPFATSPCVAPLSSSSSLFHSPRERRTRRRAVYITSFGLEVWQKFTSVVEKRCSTTCPPSFLPVSLWHNATSRFSRRRQLESASRWRSVSAERFLRVFLVVDRTASTFECIRVAPVCSVRVGVTKYIERRRQGTSS